MKLKSTVRMQQPQDIKEALIYIKPFLNNEEFVVIRQNMSGEEKDFFIDKVKTLAKHIRAMPATYGQDGLGDNSIIHLHYFHGYSDWYITEKDVLGDGTNQAFGFTILNGDIDNAEFGYISIAELVSYGVELDLYYDKTTIGEMKMIKGVKR